METGGKGQEGETWKEISERKDPEGKWERNPGKKRPEKKKQTGMFSKEKLERNTGQEKQQITLRIHASNYENSRSPY